jgi:guanine deaminase
VTVWDWSTGSLDAERQRVARGLHERVFAWMTLADERHLAATWVAGQERYRRSTT